ncbi:uncharacterized protein [Aristolochia californica]|uniref:uncharacterized protein n=1 Tax=Aristolochia californica TaxID=171875 RepID=UPI0035DF46A4
MTSRFNYVVCSIEESNNLDTLTIDELQSSLLVHEQRMNEHGRGDEQTLKRHFQYECPEWEKEANYAELEEKEEMLLMSYVELNQSRREDVWFIDSGCSNHMCANKEWFLDLDEEFRQSVTLGNNSKMAVLGKRNIRMQIVEVIQLIATYTPQQNGVAECKNRTIMNMVRNSKSKKLDDKSLQCVLLGMSEESKAYRLYDLVSKKIVVSRDVAFEENECWDWGRTNEEAKLDILEWGNSNEEGSEADQSEEEFEEEVTAEGGEVSLSSNLTTFEEAVQSSKWRAAMDLEIEAMFVKFKNFMKLEFDMTDLGKEGNGELMAYKDSDHAGDIDDGKNTFGYVFLLSEGVVFWSSKKQHVVALSTIEAEFVAATSCAYQGVLTDKPDSEEDFNSPGVSRFKNE